MTEDLYARAEALDAKQSKRVEALKQISKYLQLLEHNDSELDRLEYDILTIIKRKLEYTT